MIASSDAVHWRSAYLASERGVDLRDPKLSVTPDGRLMLLMGGSAYQEGLYVGRRPRVMLSADGIDWDQPTPILSNGDWLWRVTWFQNVGYGISYNVITPTRWSVTLVTSGNGINFRKIVRLRVGGKPNEATIRFRTNGDAVVLVRREGGDRTAWIGESAPPYREWAWRSTGERVGGPNILLLPDGTLWAAGRFARDGEPRTTVARFEDGRLEPCLDLPSGGDCSYPGLVWHRRRMWLSYYSSHEGACAVYLAKIRV